MENAPVKVDLTKPMSRREIERYRYLKEKIVDTIAAAFNETGKALDEIDKEALYRGEFKTFEQCTKSLFDIGKSRAYQLIAAHRVYEQLSTVCGQNEDGESDIIIDVLPVNEAQIRPLLKVSEPERPKVWSDACSSSPKHKPSSGHINKVVKQYLGDDFKEKLTRTSTAVQDSKLISADIKAIFQQLLQAIYDTKKGGYKTTSRLALCNHLDTARSLISGDGDNIAENKIERSNREKLMRAGYAFIRADRVKGAIMIEDRTATGWQVLAAPPNEQLDYQFASLLKENDKYLAD